ncbi:MAG: hypothetical protein ABI759_13800 [Candidatus Solibacter sp.]
MRLVTLALLLSNAALAAEIPKGAHALLRLVNSVSTRTARVGDYVYLRTAMPIVNGSSVLVPEGSYVTGVVTHATRSGRVKGTAELGIRIETLMLPSGKVIQLSSPSLASVESGGSEQRVSGKEGEIRQGTSHGGDAVKVAGLSGAGAAMGGISDNSWKGAGIGAGVGAGAGLASVLLTRGKEVEMHQGSTIDVVFDRPVAIE